MAVVADTAYRTLTEACGVVDRSERGKLALTGSEAKAFLHGQVTNDVEGLEPGRGCYAAFLTHKGKMLGDLRVLDLGDELLLDTERGALQELFNMIRRYKLGRDVELHKRTLELGLLSLVGPEARRVADAEDLVEEHANRRASIAGVEVVLVATDVGVDLFVPADAVETVRGALGVPVVADEVAEIVRVERGRPRYGIDLDDGVIPQEAGLNERAVSFSKGCYVGQETVARLHYRGKPNRHLRGLRLSAPAATGDVLRLPAPPTTGDVPRSGAKEVGRLGSVAVSPAHGPIALALVRREAAVGDTLAVGEGGVTAEVVEVPFEG